MGLKIIDQNHCKFLFDAITTADVTKMGLMNFLFQILTFII